MMRGKIELGNHKLAGVFRPPAARERWKRARREKCPDACYGLLWKLVGGAVRDTFASHPEYLTEAGRRSAECSIVKRVTGTLYGYATQVAQGRSAGLADAPADAAAIGPNTVTRRDGASGWLHRRLASLARVLSACLGMVATPSPKFTGARDAKND